MAIPISIIIPVYNAERYLKRTLNSILYQSISAWECILVDDGSTDKSGEICDSYAQIDTRFRVIHKANEGVSRARNCGINEARGEWLTFVDADDSLLDNFLSSMISTAERNPDIDIVFDGYAVIGRSATHICSYESKEYIGKSEIGNLIGNTEILHRCCPWGKLFRRSVIMDNKILFDSKLLHSEDRLFLYDFLLHSRGIAVTSTLGYIYDSTNSNSLKNRLLGLEMIDYRQLRLQDATHAVIRHFGIKGEGCFIFAKNIFGLFSAGIRNIYENKNNCKSAIDSQKLFFARYFDYTLYSEIETTKRWKEFIKSNPDIQLAISGEFKKINIRLQITDAKITISRFISKILKRTPAKIGYLQNIHVMNKING